MFKFAIIGLLSISLLHAEEQEQKRTIKAESRNGSWRTAIATGSVVLAMITYALYAFMDTKQPSSMAGLEKQSTPSTTNSEADIHTASSLPLAPGQSPTLGVVISPIVIGAGNKQSPSSEESTDEIDGIPVIKLTAEDLEIINRKP